MIHKVKETDWIEVKHNGKIYVLAVATFLQLYKQVPKSE